MVQVVGGGRRGLLQGFRQQRISKPQRRRLPPLVGTTVPQGKADPHETRVHEKRAGAAVSRPMHHKAEVLRPILNSGPEATLEGTVFRRLREGQSHHPAGPQRLQLLLHRVGMCVR